MSNPFHGIAPQALSAPAAEVFAITPDNSNDIPGGAVRALWVGTAGDITIDDVSGNTSVVLKGVQGLIPVLAQRVRVTASNAASDIVGMR